jgi:hypothetical protein
MLKAVTELGREVTVDTPNTRAHPGGWIHGQGLSHLHYDKAPM